MRVGWYHTTIAVGLKQGDNQYQRHGDVAGVHRVGTRSGKPDGGTDVTEGFDLTPAIDQQVPPGTNLLVTGPPLSGKRTVFVDLLTASFTERDAAVAVTTNDTGESVLSTLAERVDPAQLRGVDCTQDGQGNGEQITSVSNPGDLTGIGMNVDRHLSELSDAGYRSRLGLLTVSTLLVYSDFQPVYRFLHVVTGRVAATGGLGVFVVDSDTHDEQVMSAITSLFDGRIDVNDGEMTAVGL